MWGNSIKIQKGIVGAAHALALITGVAGLNSFAHADPVVGGFNAASLPSCDDCYVGPIGLGFSANFFGSEYSTAYVSNNGYITFGAGQDNYTPTGLTSGYNGNPIIAAFYADVDTRAAGTTSYGSGAYAGHNAFGVTWTNVGYYPGQTDKTNTFQEILVNRSDIANGDFDIYFNYDQIQWETGGASGGTDGLGGTSAAVGYANGSGNSGTYYQLDGSLAPGSFIDGGSKSLVVNSNDGIAGQYAFQVRSGSVTPVSAAPEPATWTLLIAGVAVAGGALRSRRRGWAAA